MKQFWVRLRFEVGQTTAEYALVLLAAGAVAYLLIVWASNDQGGISEFFTAVIEEVKKRFVDGAPTPGG